MRTRPFFYYFGNWVLRFIFRVILRVDVRGLENVPPEGSLIVAVSHSSFLDPILAGVYLPRDITPMAKIEAFNLPVLGMIVRLYGAFPVRRGAADMGAIKVAFKVLEKGQAMLIAPEGHRSDSGALQRGHEGAIMLSIRSGAPILPVAIWGGKPFWKNLPRLRRTAMYVYVAPPVIPTGVGLRPTREQMAQMSDELMVYIAEMMPPEIRGYYADLSKYEQKYLLPVKTESGAVPVLEKKEVVAL